MGPENRNPLSDRKRGAGFALALALFIALTFSARAQSLPANIAGIVLDLQTGKPIENATASVIGIDSTRTDSSGNFVLRDIPVLAPFQLVTLTVTAPGHGTWTMREAMLYPNITRTLTIQLGPSDEWIVAGLPRALTGDQPIEWRDDAPRVPRYFSNDVPPTTIKVGITDQVVCNDWVNAGRPVKRVDVLDFKTYVKNVLPNEWLASWGNDAPDALRAGAMAVKMFAWWRVNLGGTRPLGAEVVDNTCDQRYVANTHDPRTDAAVDATWDFIMRRNAQVIEIHYLATVPKCQASLYPPCMPQWGTYYDALYGVSWQAILQRYYGPVEITPAWLYLPLLLR